ncbi:MAG TPA: 50S ribosomal protein L10 [Candidatus Acidoferrum sp.]|nr:50S ribosomal protein L10 [Candidatus Acidoferrum sp.]
MLTKDQKIKFVKEGSKELSKYSTVGIVNLGGIPDRLLQRSRNGMKTEMKLILGRRNLLVKILESSEKSKKLAEKMTGTSAIVLSNADPFELFKGFKSNEIRLAAKPKQIAPEDILVQSGETSLQPGAAVTELKQAGIDVQIQKGKVVISKEKVLVKKGEPITKVAAKVLQTLGTMPFKASILPFAITSNGMTFTKEILDIDPNKTISDIISGFRSAFFLSMERGIINQYTVKPLIVKAFMQARALGIESKAYEPGIIEVLLGSASAQASALSALGQQT